MRNPFKRRKYTYNLTEELDVELGRLAAETGKSKEEIWEKAVALLKPKT